MNKTNEDDTINESDVPYDGDGEEVTKKKKVTFSEKIKTMKNDVNSYMADHPKFKLTTSSIFIVIVSCISAFIFAYGFLSFTNPLRVPFTSIPEEYQYLVLNAYSQASGTVLPEKDAWLTLSSQIKSWYNSLPYNEALELVGKRSLVSGGASGMSQVITRILSFTGMFEKGGIQENTMISILYLVINIPFLILAWLKIGKKFSIYTLCNILFSALFIKIIPASWCELTNIYNDYLARALAGGLCTGLGTGLAFAVGAATGIVDIIAIFFAEKKSTSVGKYSMMVNVCTVVIYTLLHFIISPSDAIPQEFENDLSAAAWNQGVNQTTMALYTIVYFYVSSKILDVINIKNKKVEIQVFTTNENMAQILIGAFPHACTLVTGIGGYTGEPRHIIYMVISKGELNKAIEVMKQADPHSFVSVLAIHQVYGKFYIKPLE